jgi:hypothetical protein
LEMFLVGFFLFKVKHFEDYETPLA